MTMSCEQIQVSPNTVLSHDSCYMRFVYINRIKLMKQYTLKFIDKNIRPVHYRRGGESSL